MAQAHSVSHSGYIQQSRMYIPIRLCHSLACVCITRAVFHVFYILLWFHFASHTIKVFLSQWANWDCIYTIACVSYHHIITCALLHVNHKIRTVWKIFSMSQVAIPPSFHIISEIAGERTLFPTQNQPNQPTNNYKHTQLAGRRCLPRSRAGCLCVTISQYSNVIEEWIFLVFFFFFVKRSVS